MKELDLTSRATWVFTGDSITQGSSTHMALALGLNWSVSRFAGSSVGCRTL